MASSSGQYSGGSGTKPSIPASGREGQQRPHRHDHQRGQQQRAAGPALDERDLVGADDVDDQGLGEQALHEPAGVEQGRVAQAVEDVQHDEVGQVVEDRADRPDEQDEAAQLADGPLARLLQPLRVDLVGGDGGLREIVQQVVGQHLDRQHGHERQEEAGARAR